MKLRTRFRFHLAACMVSLLPVILAGGCNESWRPERAASQPAATTQPATVSDYLPEVRSGTWVYRRAESAAGSGGKARSYKRIITSDRIREGVLIQRQFEPIQSYLAGQAKSAAPTAKAPLEGGLGIFLEVAEPLDPLPESLATGQTAQSSTELHWYNKDGKLEATGTMSRTAQIEGVETVEVPAGKFENALRVRVEMTGEFPWGPVVKWTTYLWLAPEAGEVRRIEHISGLFWIVYFQGAYEYQLLSWELDPIATGAKSVPHWKRGAILFDRTVPRPSIAGAVIDLAEPLPTSVPGDTPADTASGPDATQNQNTLQEMPDA